MAHFEEMLTFAKITVITYPRDQSRADFVKKIFSRLDIYRTVVDPEVITPSMDIVIFSSPSRMTPLNTTNESLMVIVISTWGDSQLETDYTVQYLASKIDSPQIRFSLDFSDLNHTQLLYYDRISVAYSSNDHLRKQLQDLIGLAIYSRESMESIIERSDYSCIENENTISICPKVYNLKSRLSETGQGISLIYTSNSDLISQILSAMQVAENYIITNSADCQINNAVTSVHFLDNYSFSVMKTLLEKIYENSPLSPLEVYLYVNIHPNIDSIDKVSYEQLYECIKESDEVYGRNTNNYLLSEDFKVYSQQGS